MDINTNKSITTNTTTSSTPPPPPPPPIPTISTNINKENLTEYFKIIIPEHLKGTESEKEINSIGFLPEKPVCYIPFHFYQLNKSIISSSWIISDNESNISIDKQLIYSDKRISYIPKREDANKILQIEIKLSSSLFTENTLEKKSNIISKLFHSKPKTTNNIEPIIIQFNHKILFEHDRELLKINEPTNSNNNNSRYRVIQYNILAECYIGDSWYYNLPPYAIGWDNYRSYLLISQILKYNTDIIGLQEVDRMYWQLFKELNEKGGYSYYPNYNDQDKQQVSLQGFNNEYREGCFIFFKKDRFSLLKGLELNYKKLMDPNQKLLPKELIEKFIQDPIYKTIITQFLQHSVHHVHHCLVLLEDKVTKQKIIVVSKHLYWGSEGPDQIYQIKSVQIHLFTVILKEFIKLNQLEHDIPIIVCGDFNSSPGSTCYNFMVNGYLPNNDQNLTLNGKYPPAFSSESFNDQPDIKSIKHNFNFKSVYSFRPDGEPKFTIVTKSFSGNIDQIFITNNIIVNNILEIGEKKDYKLLPSLTLASDHILLMFDLELQSKDSKK